MPEAIRAKDTDPDAAVKEAKKTKRRGQRRHADKTFDSLTNPQKDELLKEVALKLGLIAPDP